MPTLVIVESPAKYRTIQRCLGQSYLVRASLGHLPDVPAAGGRRNRAVALGLDPEDGWKATGEVPGGKRYLVKGLRRLAGRKEAVVLATDCDRESWRWSPGTSSSSRGPAARFARVTFNEVTEPAIRGAFRESRCLDMALVRAQLTRRFVDRLVGWRVSPALVRWVAEAPSARHVQSVALSLVVEREGEIRAFAPRPYWEVVARVDGPGEPVSLPVVDAGVPNSSDPGVSRRRRRPGPRPKPSARRAPCGSFR